MSRDAIMTNGKQAFRDEVYKNNSVNIHC